MNTTISPTASAGCQNGPLDFRWSKHSSAIYRRIPAKGAVGDQGCGRARVEDGAALAETNTSAEGAVIIEGAIGN